MRYPPGTQVWVRCDDGVWWPAKVKEMEAEMCAFLSDGEDCCVEFYHSPGELYPIDSSDDRHICVLHARPQARTATETEWFAHEDVQVAVSKALRDQQQVEAPLRITAHALPPPPLTDPVILTPSLVSSGAAPTIPATTTPFSAAELRNIQALLDAVGPQTSSLLRQQLRHASVSVAARDVQKQGNVERQTRKRQRAAATVIHAPPAPVSKAVQQWRRDVVAPLPVPPTSSSSATQRACVSPPAASEASDWSASSNSHSDTSSFSHTAAALSSAAGSTNDTDDALPFVPAVRRHVVEVLRHEVFDNPAKFILSPIYQFVEILGAVVVENASLATALPSPRALREVPADGFAPQRRVLLVPLTENYDHTTGWMVPMELDGVSLAMKLFINNTPVSLPPNWSLSPAKEAAAVKTAMAVDVTDVVLRSPQDLFSLHVVFTGDVADMEMWRGVIACVFVEEIGLAQLGERVVCTYRKPRAARAHRSLSHSRGPVDITEASVKIQCPITTLTMEIPVRSVHCEHLQCMELAAVLIQCVRQNVWNCPLCNAPMKPENMRVNYRLRDWIASHPQQLSRVEYVVETELGHPLKAVYREVKVCDTATVEVVDDDDDND